MLKKYLPILLLAFVLNWVWEIMHSVLYVHYKGGEITDFILFRAAIGDAFMILFLVWAAERSKMNKVLFITLVGLAMAVLIEIAALNTGRWAYRDIMPIIPILGTGLTPTIQLVLTGLIAKRMVFGSWK